MELEEKTAIVTGSTGRLGCAITLALAKAGCNCICHYNTNRKAAHQLTDKIRSLGREAIALQADLCMPEKLKNLFDEAIQIGVPQVLVNSAAIFLRQRLDEVTFEDTQRVLNLNLTVPIMTSRHFGKLVNSTFHDAEGRPKRERGNPKSPTAKIINIADVGGIRPWAEYAAYCASKAGLIAVTKALAKELAPAICVNAVAPGVITWPDDFDGIPQTRKDAFGGPDEQAGKRQLSFIPAKRLGDVSEIASAVVFLLKNDYITGTVLNVDGGRCI